MPVCCSDANEGCKIISEVGDEISRRQHSGGYTGHLPYCTHICTACVDRLRLSEPKQPVRHLAHTGVPTFVHTCCNDVDIAFVKETKVHANFSLEETM